jgi:hypothetical protein
MRTLILLFATTAACTTTDSSDVLTSGINAAISASTTGDGTTTVSATLYLGNPLNLNFVDLTGDDRLVASHGSEEKTMTESNILNVVSHTATFDTGNEGDEFNVDFQRTVDDGAPSSTMMLPAPFEIDTPTSTTVSRAEPFTLTWNVTSADSIRWQVYGDCIEILTGSEADIGAVTIEAGAIKKRMGDGVVDSCPMTVAITRVRAGELDPGYGKGGSAEGLQVRSIPLTTAP